MKKETTKFFGIVFIFFLLVAKSVSAQNFAGGTGSASDPYIITNAEQLFKVRTALSAYYILQNDIDLSGYQEGEGWLPIQGFSGNMDGKGYTIKNLKINRPTANYQGLFAQIVPPNSEVKNLNVSGDITADSHSGGIAGQCFGVISNCSFTGTVKGKTQHVGGICGMVMTQGPSRATIKNCFNAASVSASTKSGGIAGFASDATVTNCFNTGAVKESISMAGGIVGFNNNSNILNCYNEGKVTGKEDVGGITGFTNPATCSINKCYNVGDIEGTANVGGIIGKNAETIVSNCFAINGKVSGDAGVIGRIWGKSLGSTSCYSNNFALNTMKVKGATITSTDASSQHGLDKSLEEVRTESTYQISLGWDFTNDWAFVIGYNPLLRGISSLPSPLFEGGKGTETTPYIISKPIHLDNVRKAPSANFVFQNDIDLIDYQVGEGWVPISRFEGRIDGKGFAVKNLKINRPKSDYQGLIGSINSSSTEPIYIENLSVSGEIVGKKSVGGLIGSNYNGNIKKCSFSGIITGVEHVGGLVGNMSSDSSLPEENRLSITDSYNYAKVSTQGTGGGLVGLGSYINISRCYNSGTISAQYGFIGGIIGSATGWSRGQGPSAEYGGTTVSDCYNTGTIENGYQIGGIVGNCAVSKTLITKSYNIGNIITDSDAGMVGGIAGTVNDATVSNCVAGNTELKGLKASRITAETSGTAILENNYALSSMSVNGGVITNGALATVNGLDKTIKELKLRPTYEVGLKWDFADVWVSVQGYFPVLKNVSEIPQEVFAGGSGSSEDPYIIMTAAHLNNVRTALDAHYIMEADVDLSGYQTGEGWTPIALGNTTGFLGTFNGKGHKISNLKIIRPEKDGQSLFGYSRGAVIDSIVIENASVYGKNKTALLVSQAIEIKIRDCKVSGIVQAAEYAAGIIGYSQFGSVINCRSNTDIKGFGYLAGIAGLNGEGTLSNCINSGKIEFTTEDKNYKYAGGITSFNAKGIVEKCGNENDVICHSRFVGGVIGMSNEGTINKCYNKGNVKGFECVGGLCGVIDKDTISNSYNTGMVSGMVKVGGAIGNAWLSVTTGCYNDGDVNGPDKYQAEAPNAATGGVFGVHDQSTATYCYNNGKVSGYDFVGGVAGANTGIITKSFNNGTVKALQDYAGGIAGTNSIYMDDKTIIRLCYNTGSVEGSNIGTGGIAGINSGIIGNNYNTGFIKGVTMNGGIVGYNRTVLGGVTPINFCLNRGNVQGSDIYHGGIVGKNGYSGQVTFCMAANEQINGVESYRIIGAEDVNSMNYHDNNFASETMLVNGVKISGDDPLSFDGKGISLSAFMTEETYSNMGWDFDDNWYMAEGISYPIFIWQPRLSGDINKKISVKLNETHQFSLTLDKQNFEVSPMDDITWDYDKDKGITITSTDNLSFTVTGNKLAGTILSIDLKGGNSLRIPIEITDGSSIEENSISHGVRVYPNPVLPNGELTIDLNNLNESIHWVRMYDVSSRLVQSMNFDGTSQVSVPVGSIASGTYILNILTESGKNISRNIVVK